MGNTFKEVCTSSLNSMRRTIELLNLTEEGVRSSASNLAWLRGARAKLMIACSLLDSESPQASTLVSVSELILKAELCLATIDVHVNALSMRIADALLLETRVKIENFHARAALGPAAVPRYRA
jgi:hypothetical protein